MLKYPKHTLIEIEKHLQKQKIRIAKQLVDLISQDPFSDTDRLSDNAASDAEAKEEFNHDRYQAMISEVKEEQTQIDAALKRIEDGTYGICTNCKELIDTDRLAAIPAATLCMNCGGNKR